MTPNPSPRRGVLFWLGLALAGCGGVGFFAAVHTLQWELKTAYWYKQGQCRIMSAQVVAADGVYRLEVRHRVEADGRTYRTCENTEQDTPTYNTRAEAEERLARSYPVGSLQPCWYDAADPDRHSVLVTQGLRPLRSLAITAATLAVAAAGAWLVRRGPGKNAGAG